MRGFFCGTILSGDTEKRTNVRFFVLPARKLTAGNFDHDQDQPHFSTVECDSGHDQL